MAPTVENLVHLSKQGDREALEELVGRIQGRVYGLAVRMLGHPEDAEDAAQEILIKVITHLSDFREESAFTTWVYRVAANHLLNVRKQRAERSMGSFEDFAESIDAGLASEWNAAVPIPELGLMLEEMMISCTQGMLLCLDRDQRLAYILGDIFKVSGAQGAYVLDVSPEAYRQRLSRARTRMTDFMHKNCSLVNPSSPCTCARQTAGAIAAGARPEQETTFTGRACRVKRLPEVLKNLEELKELERVAAVFQSHPEYQAPETVAESLKSMIRAGRGEFFRERPAS